MRRIHTKVVFETDELTHYGVLGMRWGRRRAERAAEKSSRAAATAKVARSESNRVASNFDKVANTAEKAASDQAGSGKIVSSIASRTYAKANKDKANETRVKGKDLEKYYNSMSAKKAMKARKLAEKYGDEETKKKVEALIKKKSNNPFDVEFDEEDPVVAAVRSGFEDVQRARRYQEAKERWETDSTY